MVKNKTNKMRGGKSNGYGSKKKHRGGGSRGGKGYGGLSKHKRSFVYSKKKDHFGKKGFYSGKKEKAINVGDLSKFKEKMINLKKMKYDKLLGNGEVDNKLIIIINKFSKSAKEKIEKAGGEIKSE